MMDAACALAKSMEILLGFTHSVNLRRVFA